MKRYALLCLLLAVAWPIDAQEVIVPLRAHYYIYGDTSDVQHPEFANGKDGISARLKPLGILDFDLPKQPMSWLDGHPQLNDGQYEDSIGIWMSCPAGYQVSFCTADHIRQHTEIAVKYGPLEYGLYWYPFSSPKYVDTWYGGSMYASVQIREIEGVPGSGYAMIDAAVFKYLEGTLSVDSATRERSCVDGAPPSKWYTFPLLQQVGADDGPFQGTPAEAGKVLPPGYYISQNGYKLAIGGRH